MGARVRVIAPPTLLPAEVERLGRRGLLRHAQGLEGCDIVMMLRLQTERMQGSFVPSIREYFRFFGLDRDKLQAAKPDALIMHPGPMNRGVEIDSELADDIDRSVIREQVEMGVAVRMACLDALADWRGLRGPVNATESMRRKRPHGRLRQRAAARPGERPRRARRAHGRGRRDRRPGPPDLPTAPPEGIEVDRLRGHCLAPGLVDMRVQLREPGEEHKETIRPRAGGGGRRRHHPGRAAQHRAGGRRRRRGRVRRPPGARGQAGQGLHLRRADPRPGGQGADRARPAEGIRRGRLHRRRHGGGRRQGPAPGARLRPHLRPDDRPAAQEPALPAAS